MRKFTISAIAIAAALAACAFLADSQGPPARGGGKGKAGATVQGSGLYQRQPETPTGPAPMLKDGTPDLSGVWLGAGANDSDMSLSLKPGDSVEMLPWAEKLVATRKSQEDPEANCLPAGVPRGSPYPWRIAQTPGIYFIVYEGNIHSWRQIFMDGRGHTPDNEMIPSWYGNSIGHWDGRTWVVDTTGFNDKFWFDYKGHPHTEQLHTVERYTRTDMGHMDIEVTINDPGTYRKPFTTVGHAKIMAGTELMEYICQEDNFDLQHISGPAKGPGGGR